MAGGQSANNIARWNGTIWQPLGSGLNTPAQCLAVYAGEVVVGGNFTLAGGQSALLIARWLGAGAYTAYCTSGTTASGCQASIGASGVASVTVPSGFLVGVTGAEGDKDGLFFFGSNGRQASPWGNGTSYQCVVPPVKRSPVQPGAGINGACDGGYLLDFNALIAAQPAKAPAVGATVQIQCWFRDPLSTSNQTTSLSDALEFTLCQ
jgi:hypothetical protein